MKRLAKVPWRKLVVATDFRRTPQPLAKLREGGVGLFQPSRSERRTAAAGQYALALIARTRDPFERSTRACEQFVLDMRDIDLRGWPPFQCLGYIARPNAPCGTVSELHHMAPIVLLDLHRRSPCDGVRMLYCIGVDILGAQRCQPSGATARATIRPKGEFADEFFRECRDRSAPLPESNRIPPPRGPDR